MKTLLILLIVFSVSLVLIKFFYGNYEYALSGRIAFSVMLIYTSIGHFAFAKGMSMMLPEFIPFKIEIVYLTGILEILFAIGLFFTNLRVFTAYLLIVFLIMILPANIYASMKQLNFQKATFDGNGLSYLWFRIPEQILFIVWIYLSSIRN